MIAPPNLPALLRAPVVVPVLVLAASMWAFFERAELASSRSTCHTQLAHLAAMQADAARIERLRAAPRQATDRQRPHDELAAQIEQAGQRAGLGATALASLWPETPQRLPQSDYPELTTRLGFEDVDLQKITAFAYHLQVLDASLQVTQLRLTAPRADTNHWDVELSITYSIYAPRGSASTSLVAGNLVRANAVR